MSSMRTYDLKISQDPTPLTPVENEKAQCNNTSDQTIKPEWQKACQMKSKNIPESHFLNV